VTYWKESDIEVAIATMNDFANYRVCFRSESSVTSKEARLIPGVHEIHVGRAPPSIY
jgi:hypothetical protein